MEELIKKVFNEKLNDGTIEEIVKKKIDEMISSILQEQMNWNGAVKKGLEERLKPIMLKAVADCDLSKTAAIVTDLLNRAVKTSPIHLINDTYDGIKTLFSVNEELKDIRIDQKVKLSDIFAFYVKSLSNETYYKSDLEDKSIDIFDDYDGEGEYAYIGAAMEVERTYIDDYFGRRKEKIQVTLSNNYTEKDIVFDIKESYDGDLRIDINTEGMLLAELRHLPETFLYLIQLKSYWCEIEIDTEGESDEEIKVQVS